jgi:hypothetical protein
MEETRGSYSRRNMLIAAGGAAAAIGATVALPYRAGAAARTAEAARTRPSLAGGSSLASAGYDEWARLVGTSFALGGGQALVLAGVRAVDSAGPRPAGTRDRAFIAAFDLRGARTMAGDQIYTVSNPASGPFQIFLSAAPDARTPGRMLAVFN